MVPVLHAGTPHRVSLRGFERSHPQLVCVLIREMVLQHTRHKDGASPGLRPSPGRARLSSVSRVDRRAVRLCVLSRGVTCVFGLFGSRARPNVNP